LTAEERGSCNKKKQVFQSTCHEYTTEVASSRDVDGNPEKPLRETLKFFQKDLRFAERRLTNGTSALKGSQIQNGRPIFKGRVQ